MLSVNTIASVVVNVAQASPTPSSFDTGLILAKDASYADTRRLQEFVDASEAAAALLALGFATNSTAYKAVAKYFAANPAPSKLLFSCYPSSETLSQALDAVLDLTSGFYGIVVASDSLTDTNYLNFDEHIRGLTDPKMLFVPVTGTPASAVAANSLLDKLHTAATKRAVACYVQDMTDIAAIMGTAMGLELSHKESAFALCYKTIYGIQTSDLTQTQVSAIQALNGNVYVVRGYSHLLFEKGSTSSGFRYDEMLYLDRIADDLRNEAVNMLAENTDKLPQTDDSSAQFINRFSSILSQYASRGILATGIWNGNTVGPVAHGDVLEDGFILWADSYDNQSESDRASHKAMPINVVLHLSGSIESLLITVNVSL